MGRLRSKPVEDFMNRDPISVSKDEQIGVALEIMEKEGVTHLPVLSGSRVVGVIAAWDLMEGLGSARLQGVVSRRVYVSSLMTEPAITVSPTDTLGRAISLFKGRDISFLPVVDGDGNLLGTLTETDLMRLLSDRSDPPVSELMTVNYPRILPIDRIVHARSKMLETGARVLPVVDQGTVVGLVTDFILAKAFMEVREKIDPKRMDAAVRRILIEDVMMESPPTLSPTDHAGRAAEVLSGHGIPAVPVVERDLSLAGVIARKTLLNLI